jgi:hypothetical protein
MIIGAAPFSFMMIPMGMALLKALIRDDMRGKEGSAVPEAA